MLASIWSNGLCNQRRYGGTVVHLGLSALADRRPIQLLKRKQDIELKPGQSAVVIDYTVTIQNPTDPSRAGPRLPGAELQVDRRGQGRFARLEPDPANIQATGSGAARHASSEGKDQRRSA